MIDVVINAIWEGLEADDNCYADREMDVIDTGGSYDTFSMGGVARHVLARLRAAAVIDTVEALHDLPTPSTNDLAGVLIKSTALVDPANGKYGLGDVYERNTDGTWCMLQDPSGADWGERTVPSTDIPLPAIVLWVPGS